MKLVHSHGIAKKMDRSAKRNDPFFCVKIIKLTSQKLPFHRRWGHKSQVRECLTSGDKRLAEHDGVPDD